ncbi:MAG: formyltetrahydrofolate deformylase [Eudoraea sp.]|nr:formyltetrahydrofolate deformylase [Eudoraea sp.]
MAQLTVLISCKDQQGIIANTTQCVAKNHGNIVYIDQHVDGHDKVFFMRIECVFTVENSASHFREQFELGPVKTFQMDYEITSDAHKPVMALMVSKYDHCLYDLLGRYRSGEMDVEIPLIISNHIDLKPIADAFEIPFYHIPVDAKNKDTAEDQQLELLHSHKVDFIVLARYMQIVSEKFLSHFKNSVINIHHSFLPAFPGAKPYHSAYKRGVKIIGATSHYVTKDLDEGPIIEQDVAHVDHAHSINDLIIKGRDLEKVVLARAIKKHLKRKVLVYNNKTIVFR